MRIIGTRVKKADFSNDLSVVEDFRLNPQIQFNFGKLSGEGIPAGKQLWMVAANITIEGTKEFKSPIRINILVESRIEFDNESEAEVQNVLKNTGINIVYEHAKSVLAALTLVCGIAPIALPDLDKLSQNAGNNQAQ